MEQIHNIIYVLLFTLSLSVSASKAFVIDSKSWQYNGHHIGYEVANPVIESSSSTSTCSECPILLLNGFGVGSFHQHRLMPNLISVPSSSNDHHKEGDNNITRTVYGIDYLGQGRSWPIDCNDGNSENEKGLIYSIDTWVDQIIDFIEMVIIPNHSSKTNYDSSEIDKKKVHLIGNSVGGHLSAILAAKRPDLVESICLLNATPVWGLNLPFWSGVLPPPPIPRKIGRVLFDKIRDLATIEQYLDNAYSSRDAFDEELMKQIRACTEGKGGHAAFASIMWSPPTEFNKDFYSILTQVKCDVLLIFGKNDPWCTPAFAKRMYQSLQQRNQNNIHRYIELDNVGHCPNHEAPQAVGFIASRWTSSGAKTRDKEHLSLLNGDDIDAITFHEPWGDVIAREINENEINLSLMEKIITSLV